MSYNHSGHLYSTHSQRVQGVIALMKDSYLIQDRQNRISYDVSRIEEHFNEIGLEIRLLRVHEFPKSFMVNIELVEGPFNDRGAVMQYNFEYAGKFDDMHWPIQSKWKPYENPVGLKGWTLCQHNPGNSSRWLLEGATLEEVLNEYFKVRNFILQLNTR